MTWETWNGGDKGHSEWRGIGIGHRVSMHQTKRRPVNLTGRLLFRGVELSFTRFGLGRFLA